MDILEKKQVSGFINPRWMKPRCVRYWEIGAIPAILGLWIPDFAGQYALKMAGESNYAFPPFITYVGALFLFAACIHAIEKMGTHYNIVIIGGWSAVALAGVSVILHFMITPGNYTMLALTILCIGLCAYAATMMLYMTIAKAAEIGMETRMARGQLFILISTHFALLLGGATTVAIFMQSEAWILLLRLTVIAFTAAWFACRLAVYYFKTDKSIGVFFAEPPDEQFWV